jgi:hypothetical protein
MKGWFDLADFGAAPVLRALMDSKSLKRGLNESEANSDSWLGYSLAIAVVIDRTINSVLDHPSRFGIRRTETIERSFQGEMSFLEFPIYSKQGRLVTALASSVKPFKAVRTFEQFEAAASGFRGSLLNEFAGWVEGFRFSNLNGGAEITVGEVLRNAGPVYLHFYLHDIRFIKLAFNHNFRQDEQHLGQHRLIPEVFFLGYKRALVHAWNSLAGKQLASMTSISKLENVGTWKELEALYYDIQGDTDDEFEAKLRALGASKKKSSKAAFTSLLGDARPRPHQTLEERLDQRFLHYQVRIVDEEWTGQATTGFLVAMEGAIRHIGGKVKVIRFIHPRPEGNGFGYAVLLYSPNFIWNYSQWWLFHDFCDDFDTMGNSSRQVIEKFLAEHATNLSITSFKVRANELFEYVRTHPKQETKGYPKEFADYLETETLSGMRRLLSRSEEARQVDEGVALELLALQLEMRKGYDARWRFKPRSLGKEFDVFGVKMERKTVHIHLIECTNDWDDDLVPELEGKIALVEGYPKAILSEFRTSQAESQKVTGSIITTDALDPKLKRNQGPVAIIDRERLKADCKRYRIDWPEVLDKVFPAREFVPTVTVRSLGDFKKLSDRIFKED